MGAWILMFTSILAYQNIKRCRRNMLEGEGQRWHWQIPNEMDTQLNPEPHTDYEIQTMATMEWLK